MHKLYSEYKNNNKSEVHSIIINFNNINLFFKIFIFNIDNNLSIIVNLNNKIDLFYMKIRKGIMIIITIYFI